MANHAPFFPDREKIVLTKDGIWVADGIEITHEPTRKLFAKSLVRDKMGYFIQIGRETKRIHVEDTAFFVRSLEGDPETGYMLVLSDETKVGLDPATLKYRPGRLTCTATTRIGPEEAKFLRGPYFEILKHLEEDESEYFLKFAGSRITLTRK